MQHARMWRFLSQGTRHSAHLQEIPSVVWKMDPEPEFDILWIKLSPGLWVNTGEGSVAQVARFIWLLSGLDDVINTGHLAQVSAPQMFIHRTFFLLTYPCCKGLYC